jgi:hypothetical protein
MAADRPRPSYPPSEAPPPPIQALSRALEVETALLDELVETLLEQRGAVASGDLDRVFGGSDRVTETLLKLDRARTGRRDLMVRVAGEPALPLADLEAKLGRPLPEAAVRARKHLRDAARRAERELAINRAVLRRAQNAGQAHFEALLTWLERETPLYGPSAGKPRGSERRALVVNKVA